MQASNPDSSGRQVATVLAGIVVLMACSDLAGWWLHVPILTSVLPGYATMKPNTAVCLGLTAVGVLFSRSAASTVLSQRLGALFSSGTAFLISAASLIEYLTKSNFGIDQVLYAVPMERFADPAGRMAFGTAICIILTSGALLILDTLPRLSVGLTLSALAISISGIVGYVLDAGPLIDVIWMRSLAIHTALALLLLQLATLALRPAREPFKALIQHRQAESRRWSLLAAVILLPLLLAFPVEAGMQAKFFNPRFALALLVALLMGVQTLILWADSLALNRAERKLREKEEESSRILQSIGDGVIVTDTASRIVRMNPLAEELTGWSRSEAAGRQLQDIFPIFSEATGEAVENPVEKVLRLGIVQGLANHTVLHQRNGTVIHIDDSSAPIHDDSGQLTGVVLVFRNVNDRKSSEALLRSSENKLVVALIAANLGSWELDLETMHMRCSTLCKANYGRGPGDTFSYQDLHACIHPDDRPAMQAAVQAALQTHTVYRAEYRIYWPDGTLHWVVASGQVILNAAGEPQGMVGVTLDVTERHKAAEALLQSEKLAAVGRLAASIAHEINNPLESVTNLLYLVRTNAESAEVQQFIATAERELQRASAVTNQTLRFHKQATKPTAIRSEDLIESVLSIHQGKFVNSNVTVEKQAFAERPIVCFEGEIRQVLSNLIGNAIDAMTPKGGRLFVRSREGTDWKSEARGLLITVADTGSGMSPVTSQRLFEPFYTTKGIAGTGLGLWISQEIVLRHGGRLRLRSSQKQDASGTVFLLFLPFDAIAR